MAGRARWIRIDSDRLEIFTRELLAERPAAQADPAHHRRATDEETLAFVLTLDAINFGSGWFPFLRKRKGRSGYFTVALALAEHFDREGPWSARTLRELESQDLARTLSQDRAVAEVDELLDLYARALQDLGSFLEQRHAGRFEGPVEAAGGSAARLVEELTHMPFYRDVARYRGRAVPFYKRAQITAADLRLAFGDSGPGAFEDIDELTIFADNLVPHVLRLEGVLLYDPGLVRSIEAERLLLPGSDEEVEIRACALHAVERMAAAAGQLGAPVPPRQLDEWIWARGQHPTRKAVPRHRSRTVFY
ncbi:MAG: queuosine salvage family protein [Myxococcota bacterium]